MPPASLFSSIFFHHHSTSWFPPPTIINTCQQQLNTSIIIPSHSLTLIHFCTRTCRWPAPWHRHWTRSPPSAFYLPSKTHLNNIFRCMLILYSIGTPNTSWFNTQNTRLPLDNGDHSSLYHRHSSRSQTWRSLVPVRKTRKANRPTKSMEHANSLCDLRYVRKSVLLDTIPHTAASSLSKNPWLVRGCHHRSYIEGSIGNYSKAFVLAWWRKKRTLGDTTLKYGKRSRAPNDFYLRADPFSWTDTGFYTHDPFSVLTDLVPNCRLSTCHLP